MHCKGSSRIQSCKCVVLTTSSRFAQEIACIRSLSQWCAFASCNFRHFIPNSRLMAWKLSGQADSCHIFGPLQLMAHLCFPLFTFMSLHYRGRCLLILIVMQTSQASLQPNFGLKGSLLVCCAFPRSQDWWSHICMMSNQNKQIQSTIITQTPAT